MHKERCLVVGLGNIGMGFDFKLGNQNVILSHCSAINEHDDFYYQVLSIQIKSVGQILKTDINHQHFQI